MATPTGGLFGDSLIVGGSGNDLLTAFGFSNTIDTGGGNDTIDAGQGEASINAPGVGNLTVSLDGYGNSLTGGTGNDLITGSLGQTTVSVGDGNDTMSLIGYLNSVTAGDGNSSINAGSGDSTVSTGNGNASVTVVGYEDSIHGGDGNQTVQAPQGNATIDLGNGNSLITATGYYDSIEAGDGNTTVIGPEGNAFIKLGTGSDSVQLSGYDDTVSLGNGNNTVGQTSGSASITSGSGNSSITAGGEGNFVEVGDGSNTISGTSGDSTIVAGSGHNAITLSGYASQVILSGGVDTVGAGSGLDTIAITGTALTVSGGTNATVFVSSATEGSSITDNGSGTEVQISASAGTVTINPSTDTNWSFDILNPGSAIQSTTDLLSASNLSYDNATGATSLNLQNGTTVVFEGYERETGPGVSVQTQLILVARRGGPGFPGPPPPVHTGTLALITERPRSDSPMTDLIVAPSKLDESFCSIPDLAGPRTTSASPKSSTPPCGPNATSNSAADAAKCCAWQNAAPSPSIQRPQPSWQTPWPTNPPACSTARIARPSSTSGTQPLCSAAEPSTSPSSMPPACSNACCASSPPPRRHCRRDSVILLHDCIPTDSHIARRVMQDERLASRSPHPSWWAGDVWKAAALIQRYRPDLRLYAFNTPPTGLIAITNLDPTSTVLDEYYFALLQEAATTLAEPSQMLAFFAQLDMRPAEDYNSADRLSELFIF